MDPIWHAQQLRGHIEQLLNNVSLLRAVSLELRAIRWEEERVPGQNSEQTNEIHRLLLSRLTSNATKLGDAENVALRAARELVCTIQTLAAPLEGFSDESASWEQLSGAAKIRERKIKLLRNRKRRQKRRREVADYRSKADERYQELDRQADEWRARELAKDHAKRKMENMQQLAEKKAKVERHQLEQELGMALLVEKLQELRSLRVQKLKKQGGFFPEEDNQFMERVRAASAAEEAGTAEADEEPSSSMPSSSSSVAVSKTSQVNQQINKTGENTEAPKNLPVEFYRYYYGSSFDIGTLIAVRRSWDNYVSVRGGSRIPGLWIEPPLPSSDAWASYLKRV